jgi:hypothetical protein
VATKFIFLRMAGIQAKISIVGSIVKIDTAWRVYVGICFIRW